MMTNQKPQAQTDPKLASSRIANAIVEHLELTLANDKNNENDTVSLTHEDLAEVMGCSVKSVQRARLVLEANGWQVTPGVGPHPTHYRRLNQDEAVETYAGKVSNGLPIIDKALRSMAVKGVAEASYNDLIAATGLTVGTVAKGTARLVDDGWLIERGSLGRKSRYTVHKKK